MAFYAGALVGGGLLITLITWAIGAPAANGQAPAGEIAKAAIADQYAG